MYYTAESFIFNTKNAEVQIFFFKSRLNVLALTFFIQSFPAHTTAYLCIFNILHLEVIPCSKRSFFLCSERLTLVKIYTLSYSPLENQHTTIKPSNTVIIYIFKFIYIYICILSNIIIMNINTNKQTNKYPSWRGTLPWIGMIEISMAPRFRA